MPVITTAPQTRTANASSAITYTITAACLSFVWLVIYLCRLCFRPRAHSLRRRRFTLLAAICCASIALAAWVLYVIAAASCAPDELSLRAVILALLVATTWMFAVNCVDVALLLSAKPTTHNNNSDNIQGPSTSTRSITTAMTITRAITARNIIAVSKSEEICCICLETLAQNVVKLSTCNHHFHRPCLLRWFAHSADLSCPLCKTSLSA